MRVVSITDGLMTTTETNDGYVTLADDTKDLLATISIELIPRGSITAKQQRLDVPFMQFCLCDLCIVLEETRLSGDLFDPKLDSGHPAYMCYPLLIV
jgi:hypothetical protein